ncbi:YgfZ/GcvT domain-containing protein [Camelimonas abortus]|uniref:YgfZ/GcvT domain-containing protein n=1 Tax=Camelimonas abortus TaxID=1017184 RepID=A0ABV7LET8_9HYPH
MPTAHLVDRGVVSAAGEDVATLLQGLLTCDVAGLAPGAAVAGALLTPQGKILFDFQLLRLPEAQGDGFLFDVAAASVADFIRRLNFYRLRASAVFTDRSQELAVAAGWGADAAPLPGLVWTDARHPGLGQRCIAPRDAVAALPDAGADAYRAWRIAAAVAECGADFAAGDVFPHEAGLDQFGAVSFGKGCYVGQEVVSRMQHRGTARARMMAARLPADAAAAPGDAVMAGEKRVGEIRAVSGEAAIALVRLDRAAEAKAGGLALTVNGAPLQLARPAWASFDAP